MRLRVVISFIILLACPVIHAQQDSPNPDIDSTATGKALIHAQQFLDSMRQQKDLDQMTNTMLSVMKEKERQDAARKKQAFIYIGVGLGFLAVLVFGIRRRTKPRG